MLAMGMLPRITRLMPCASGASAVKGECQAVEVCTGTMIVWPSTVTALWSEGPAPPRRLATPAEGLTSRNPKDWSSVISCRLCVGVGVGGVLMFGAPGGEGLRGVHGVRRVRRLHRVHGHR